MIIRTATLKDFEKLKEIKQEFFLWEAKRDEGIDSKKAKKIPPYLGKKLRRKDMAFFLAEDKGEIAGYAWAEKQINKYIWAKYPIKGYLHDLYIRKKYRRTGVGKRLVDECFKWFKKRKLKYIDIGVHAWNIGARKLYKKKGFEEHVIFMRQIKK